MVVQTWQISLIRCFKLLLITKVFYCGALKLHLLSDNLSLSQLFFKFRMQHREFIKDDIYINDLSFLQRQNSKSFDSISKAHKDTLLGSRLQLTFTYVTVWLTSKHLQLWIFSRSVRPYLNRGPKIYGSGWWPIHEIACCANFLNPETPIQPKIG